MRALSSIAAKAAVACACVCALALAGCDDDSDPLEPGPRPGPRFTPEVLALTAADSSATTGQVPITVHWAMCCDTDSLLAFEGAFAAGRLVVTPVAARGDCDTTVHRICAIVPREGGVPFFGSGTIEVALPRSGAGDTLRVLVVLAAPIDPSNFVRHRFHVTTTSVPQPAAGATVLALTSLDAARETLAVAVTDGNGDAFMAFEADRAGTTVYFKVGDSLDLQLTQRGGRSYHTAAKIAP